MKPGGIIAYMLCALLFFSGCSEVNINTGRAGSDTSNKDKNMWSVGFSKSGLLPGDIETETYYIAGYRNGNRATGMLDPQYARAAFISDNAGNNIVIAAVDCIGLSRSDIQKIRSRVEYLIRDCGIDAVHIMSTHTHAGIDTLGLWGPVAQTGLSEKFMETVCEGTACAIAGAVADRRDGFIYYGFADTEGLQRDSRLPEIFSPRLHRFRFEPADGSPGLQIINYGAHAEALRSENSKISADYPAYMGRKIADVTGDEFIFIAGAVGGLIMTHRLRDSSGSEYPVERNVVLTGELLADTALAIDNERRLEPLLTTRTEVFTVELENQAFIAMAFLGVINARPLPGGGRYKLALETEVSLVTLGGVKCALVPGELFPELAWGGSAGALAANPGVKNPPPLSRITGDDNLIIFGLANDEIGYIVAPDDFLVDEETPCLKEAIDKNGRSHYEETNSVGIGAAYAVAHAFEELINDNIQ
jgi:hypothetical protein